MISKNNQVNLNKSHKTSKASDKEDSKSAKALTNKSKKSAKSIKSQKHEIIVSKVDEDLGSDDDQRDSVMSKKSKPNKAPVLLHLPLKDLKTPEESSRSEYDAKQSKRSK